MARKRLTPNQQAYQEQRQRLQQSKYYVQKKGYHFDNDPVPKMPKRVTQKALEEISAMKTRDLYPLARIIDKDTGETISGTKARKLERRQSTKRRRQAQIKARRKQGGTPTTPPEDSWGSYEPETDSRGGMPITPTNFSGQIIANAKSDILHMPADISDRLVGLMNHLIQENGEDAVAQALVDMPGELHYYLQQYKYDSDGATEAYASDLVNYLPDVSDQYKSDLLEKFEYHETGYTIEWENVNTVIL